MKSEIVLNVFGLSSPCLNDILVLVFKNPERYLLKPRECHANGVLQIYCHPTEVLIARKRMGA